MMSRFAKPMLSLQMLPLLYLALSFCTCPAMMGCDCAREKPPLVTTGKSNSRQSLETLLKLGKRQYVFPLEQLEDRNPYLESEEVAEALAYITSHPDHTSYHVMMILRRQAGSGYSELPVDIRAQILSSTLGRLSFACDWSLLYPEGGPDYESGQALLETGRVAIRYLRPHLENMRPCPFLGFEDSRSTVRSHNTHQRVCDYAHYYIVKLLGETPKFNRDYKERNVAIKALKERLLQLDAIN